MRVFPGSFGADAFDALALDRYADAYRLALQFTEAEAAAVEAAMRTRRG